MARSRTIKPGFFTNDLLAELEPLVRLLFAGIWTLADREGRLLDRPRKIKAETLPYDDIDTEAALQQLGARDFLQRYEVDGVRYIQVTNWLTHQHPHPKEEPSKLPAPPEHSVSPVQGDSMHDSSMNHASVLHESSTPRSDREKVVPNRSGTSSSGTSSSGVSVRASATPGTIDEAFKRKLEDEFCEQLGSRETVRAHIGAALAHTSRHKYTDDRAYVIRWLQDDAQRAKAPPGRNGRVEQTRRSIDHTGCPAGCTKDHR